jgi:hypothetical protein
MHGGAFLPVPVLVRDWQPDFPPGDLRGVSLHWTAGDYTTVYPAYHFCVSSGPDQPLVHAAHDLRANMRDLRGGAAHTAGRNSFCIGLAICAMQGATPQDFGRYPLTEALIDGMCRVAAKLIAFYGIPLRAVRTHAEAALEDGYFGAAPDQRWDIARLAPSSAALVPAEARAAGDELRSRIAVVS